jgi:hypothetical protein
MKGANQRQRPAPAPSRSALEASDEQQARLGPQYRKDTPFMARMRLHQSWYRAHVLQLPCGTGPRASSTNHYGNMLTRADGAAGRNFLMPEIARTARERVAEGVGAVEEFRLLHNMLSSQPMCFNLFGPLVRDRALAARVLPALVPEAVLEVTRVVVEWAPEPVSEYLGDKTAFDAFIEYRTFDGRLCALGIETKLAEPFSQKEYDGEPYRRWMRMAQGIWRPEADTRVHNIQHNQLWRDHLLAIALRHHARSPYATARLLVVHHPQDLKCCRTYDAYRSLLNDGEVSLGSMSLDRIVDAWMTNLEPAQAGWLRAFRIRYLELERSAPFLQGRSPGAESE